MNCCWAAVIRWQFQYIAVHSARSNIWNGKSSRCFFTDTCTPAPLVLKWENKTAVAKQLTFIYDDVAGGGMSVKYEFGDR